MKPSGASLRLSPSTANRWFWIAVSQPIQCAVFIENGTNESSLPSILKQPLVRSIGGYLVRRVTNSKGFGSVLYDTFCCFLGDVRIGENWAKKFYFHQKWIVRSLQKSNRPPTNLNKPEKYHRGGTKLHRAVAEYVEARANYPSAGSGRVSSKYIRDEDAVYGLRRKVTGIRRQATGNTDCDPLPISLAIE